MVRYWELKMWVCLYSILCSRGTESVKQTYSTVGCAFYMAILREVSPSHHGISTYWQHRDGSPRLKLTYSL